MDESQGREAAGRRPLKARGAAWASQLAVVCRKAGLQPNVISLLSVLFAALAAGALLQTPEPSFASASVCFVVAAICVQLRLLCNLLDGMVAIEGGLKTPTGELYNELPDRVADVVILLGAGYAAAATDWVVEFAWLASVLSIGTAYVRALGTTVGAPAAFHGPMAKPHRMALMTATFLVCAVTRGRGLSGEVMLVALGVLCVGCVVTLVRRSVAISSWLNTHGS